MHTNIALLLIERQIINVSGKLVMLIIWNHWILSNKPSFSNRWWHYVAQPIISVRLNTAYSRWYACGSSRHCFTANLPRFRYALTLSDVPVSHHYIVVVACDSSGVVGQLGSMSTGLYSITQNSLIIGDWIGLGIWRSLNGIQVLYVSMLLHIRTEWIWGEFLRDSFSQWHWLMFWSGFW